jgi:hypothetical protein
VLDSFMGMLGRTVTKMRMEKGPTREELEDIGAGGSSLAQCPEHETTGR